MKPPMEHPGLMRNALERMLAQFEGGKPAWALFTTFTFSSSFFEGNVLPLLAGMPLDDLKGSKVVRAELNDALQSVRALVVCDRSSNPQAKGDMRYGLLPVGLEAGRFHPKIMLLGGTSADAPNRQALWLSVSSGNLSLSGWAVQREVVGITGVTRQHSDTLQILVRWLQQQARERIALSGNANADAEGGITLLLEDILEALAQPESLAPERVGTPTLHLAWPPVLAGETTDLLPALTRGESWERAVVVSPYWAGVDMLVDKLGVKSCMLIPAPTPEGVLQRPTSCKPDRYDYGHFRDDAARASHAKAILLSRPGAHALCVGSANFTTAAWSHGDGMLSNVEAMLRYRIQGESPWKEAFTTVDMPPAAQQANDPDAEGAPPLPPFDAEAVCDWRARRLVVRVRLHDGVALQTSTVSIGASEALIDVKKSSPQDFSFPMTLLRTIKSFKLRYTLASGVEEYFTGLVLQLNASEDLLGYKPRPRLSSVLKLLCSLQPQQKPEAVRKRVRGEGDSDEEDGIEDESTALSLDLFSFFQATFHMRRYFESHRELNPYDASSPFGPVVLCRAIALQQADSDEALIMRYVQFSELLATIEALPASNAAMACKAELSATVREELKDPEKRVRTLLGESEAFKRMFPNSRASQRSEMMISWFREQVSVAHG
ncbi:hypothetical protein HS961_20560 [Comamonas piscis]|uniref:PLD phosphodiesterase domain-containing protein n=1 Tax=Comamonas piscis TaxID=1562974 RepID=A0A7G5EM16_9BURK|nr:hypothetical protein [Comamonas piscis]QMV75041.1 hypothetical protein HS961_20560 [Comamonas piscis]WSO33522.1 hypothetical protein VUJ63_20625 [Comamonas piscis]